MSDLRSELGRRKSLTVQLEEFLKARPGEWLTMRELAEAGGFGGWRTRLSNLRLRTSDPLHIEWNKQNGPASRHRYLPHVPLGRSADVPAPDLWPAFDAPSQKPWGLTSESAEK